MVNNAGAPGTVTAIDIGALANSDTVVPTSKAVTTALAGVGGGKLVQAVNYETGAVATGSTIIPYDDTIPQNTEGDQYMSLAITPTSASNNLIIHVHINVASSTYAQIIAALFQDSTANALAVAVSPITVLTANFLSRSFDLIYKMTAGTTSATTFKIRIGPHTAATLTFNGEGGARLFGATFISSITILEVKP